MPYHNPSGNRCFECGRPAKHNHHVVPRSFGGTQTVPLCYECHGKVHGRNFANHRNLTLAGIRRAKEAGVTLGRPSVYTNEERARIFHMRKSGMIFREISEVIGKGTRRTICRIYHTFIKENYEHAN